MSDLVDMTIYAATYKDLDTAEFDCDLVKEIYYKLALLNSFDAAVLQKNQEGKVKVVEKPEQSTDDGDSPGAGRGLATGLVAALFPTAANGAIARFAVSGMSKHDLKDLGEILDDGEAGLVVIASTDLDGWMEAALDTAETVIKKGIEVEQKGNDEDT